MNCSAEFNPTQDIVQKQDGLGWYAFVENDIMVRA